MKEQKLTRRQFSTSILVGTLASGLSGLSDLFAQSEKKPTDAAILIGVEHGPIVSNSGSHINPHSRTIENYTTLPPNDTPVSALQGLTVQHLDIHTRHSKRTLIAEPLLSPSDCISGVTYLADGTLLVVITPDASSANGALPPRLLLLNEKQISGIVPVSGLSKDQRLDSVCLLRSRLLIGMVTKKDGTGPAQIVEVNPKTGAVSFTNLVSLPSNRRFSALAEAPDGKLYTSVFRYDGTTELWTLDLTNETATFLIKLTTASPCSNQTCAGFDNMRGIISWYHGIQSLMVTPAGQLLAQCNLEYILPDSVYAINVATGVMTEIVSFPVARAALSKQVG